jgi:hypothetical protein
MEYVTYILIVIGVIGLCLVVFRRKYDFISAQPRKPSAAGSARPEPAVTQSEVKLTQENRLNVPAPWGWPGSVSLVRTAEEQIVSNTLHRFVDHLFSEKQTVEDSEYLLKRNESLRLLIENRSGKITDRVNGSVRTGKHATFPDEPTAIVERRLLKEVRTPWGW